MTLIIIHDNGVKEQKGCTDYTAQEVEKKGGVNAVLAQYKKCTVYEWYWSNI